MGEYAIRRSDGERVKIGTCEEMFYIRYEDRLKVQRDANSLDPATEMNLFWRLPFPDEDEIGIGCYGNHTRGERLYTKDDSYASGLSTSDIPGTIQLTHPSGLLVNLPCYHGKKLPEITGHNVSVFWNGKSWSLELRSVKNTPQGLRPVVHCRHCNEAWSYDWADIEPYVHGELKARLLAYQAPE